MKKLYSIIIAILFALILQAQAPQKMSYQAVIRNSSDALVVNTQIGMQISILQGSANGAAVYVETQRPSTNANGLVSIEIGAGEVESGSFADIDWQSGPYFIKTETDPDGQDNYSITGTSQILSVPFALHAQTAESTNETDPEFNAWDKSSGINIDKEQVNGLGDYIETESDPVFEQSAASGITETDTENWNNKLDEESDPVFGISPAASITEADKERWNSREEFSGSYTDLSDTPENLSDFTNDAGYQLRSEDEDTDSDNEIQHLFAKSNNKIGLSGSGRFVDIPSLETDPDFNASVASGITAADTANWNNIESSHTLYLGQEYLDGIIFYLYIGSDGQQHGLVVSKTESTGIWSGSTLVGADRTEDGAYNTNLMLAGSTAKTWVAGLGTGWYLPSVDELSILWHNRFHVNKTARAIGSTLLSATANYWSSTEYNARDAFSFLFGRGYAGNRPKTDTFSVRAVRAF